MSLYPDLNCNFDLRLAMPYSRICERTSPTAMDGEITSKVIELVIFWFEVRIRKQPLCICKGKAAYNIPPPYLRIAKSLWTMGYEVFL
ncbi:hypothetical protein D0Y65_005004 [Glycine soja]|uniref:Uncharacterized protein n=1 Tax=Glycine soja TaxID=3848 RepID=A0A445LTU8_GLYSO|nr:hypothetical protein D0Y65_005004 [Glycine soja]